MSIVATTSAGHGDTYQVAVVGLEEAKNAACWGTMGKDGQGPLRFVKLVDCETDHLQAIIKTEIHISWDYLLIIKSILKDRGIE